MHLKQPSVQSSCHPISARFGLSLFAGSLLLVLVAEPCVAVPIENWRLPYYQLAAEMGLVTSSPSGMFWDNLSGSAPWAEKLWPDSLKFAENHWHVEPWVSCKAGNDKGVDGRTWFLHMDVLNDIRFRNLLVRQTLDVDSRYGKDPGYVWKKDEAMAGRIEEAYAQLDWKWGMFRLGRLKRNWGPFADRSLYLSSNPHTYDALEWQVFSKVFEFRHMFAAFRYDNSFHDVDNLTTKRSRFFAGHSLNFMIKDWATVGITETILFSRDNGFPDLQYINPFSVYTISNTNAEGSGNLMLSFQWKVHPFTKKVSLLGQLSLDDIQVENEVKGDQEPTHWGGDFAVHVHDLLPIKLHQYAKAEYRYLSRWLYTVIDRNGDRGERYKYLDAGLGENGTDGDELNLQFGVIGENFWSAELGFRSSRKGPNAITTRWSDHSEALYDTTETGTVVLRSLGYREETPLSQRDSVEHTMEFYLEARGYFRDYVDAHLRFTNRWVMNRDNIPGTGYAYDPVIAFTISAHFSDFFLRLPE